jgi:hypothetical protein
VNGKAIAVVRSALLTLTPSQETQELRDARATDFLRVPLMLHGLDVTPSGNEAKYDLATSEGKALSLVVPARAESELEHADWRYVFSSQPLYRTHPGEPFWFEFNPEAQPVYCSWRGYDNLEENAKRLWALVDSVKPRKVLVDMRQNGGGDFNLGLKYMVEPAASRRWLNARDHLFVAIGTHTFSAAMSNAAHFRTRTHARLIGEPIGERPNSYQEVREVQHPNSSNTLRNSTQYYKFTAGPINQNLPDVPIATGWKAYVAGRDPVLEWVSRR